MDTRFLVDPELIPFLGKFSTLDFTSERLPAIRRAYDAAPRQAPESSSVWREEIRIPGRDGSPPVRVLLYNPRP